jgi:hypothetical protein
MIFDEQVLFFLLLCCSTILPYIFYMNPVLRIRIRDPVPFSPLDPGSGIVKKIKIRFRDPESGMNIPDHISESLETIFWVKNN